MNNNTRDVALFFARLLVDKKAEDTIILDIKHVTAIADYFIISTAQSPLHLKMLANTIIKIIKSGHIDRNLNYEGNHNTGWLLLDCGDIVIHLFSREKRDYYNLEYIWQEAKIISFS